MRPDQSPHFRFDGDCLFISFSYVLPMLSSKRYIPSRSVELVGFTRNLKNRQTMVDSNMILERYPWYVPAHITLWQQEGVGSEITQLIAMNHSEALVEEESVDVGFFQGFSDDVIPEVEPIQPVQLAPAATSPAVEPQQKSSDDLVQRYLKQASAAATPEPQASPAPAPEPTPAPVPRKRVVTALQMLEDAAQENSARPRPERESDQIIGKFLEVKELKILATPDDGSDDEQGWQRLDIEPVFAPEDGLVNEELAKIYLDQNHYDQAKEIYNKLFLHYSEKSAYFASQVESIELLKLENQGPNKRVN